MAEFGEISTRFRFDADTRLGGFPCRSPKGYDAAPFRLSSQGRKHAAEQKGKPVIRCAPLRRVCRQSVLARRWTSSQPWRLKPEFPVSLCDERSCWIGYGGGRRHAPPLHGLTIPRAGCPCHSRRRGSEAEGERHAAVEAGLGEAWEVGAGAAEFAHVLPVPVLAVREVVEAGAQA